MRFFSKCFAMLKLSQFSKTSTRSVLHRSIGTTGLNLKRTGAESQSLKPIEYRFEVPWGHVTGKWWKSELDTKPIVLLHGWLDNAGTFDRLIPLLPKHLSYLAIDLPGHGLSSHLPNGVYYSVVQFLQVIDLVRRHFGWGKISLCSHSMGSVLSFLYASISPEFCDLLVGLDALPMHNSPDQHFRKLKQVGKHFTVFDQRSCHREPPIHTMDEMVERWVKASSGSLNKDVAPYLLNRSISRSKSDPNKYYFTKDRRLKYIFDSNYISHEVTMKLAKDITAPYLFVRANQSHIRGDRKNFEETIDAMKATNSNFEIFNVDGGHYVHLVSPTAISGKLTEFLCKHRPT